MLLEWDLYDSSLFTVVDICEVVLLEIKSLIRAIMAFLH
jgi:hypothetical protein